MTSSSGMRGMDAGLAPKKGVTLAFSFQHFGGWFRTQVV